MTGGLTAIIKVKEMNDGRLPAGKVFAISAADGPNDPRSVSVGESARGNPNVGSTFDEVRERYDPEDYEEGTVVARVSSTGGVRWPLEEDEA